MSDDIMCIGVCIVDPDTGICQGCGRAPEEISWTPPDSTCKNNEATPLSVSKVPLPPQVQREAQNPSD